MKTGVKPTPQSSHDAKVRRNAKQAEIRRAQSRLPSLYRTDEREALEAEITRMRSELPALESDVKDALLREAEAVAREVQPHLEAAQERKQVADECMRLARIKFDEATAEADRAALEVQALQDRIRRARFEGQL